MERPQANRVDPSQAPGLHPIRRVSSLLLHSLGLFASQPQQNARLHVSVQFPQDAHGHTAHGRHYLHARRDCRSNQEQRESHQLPRRIRPDLSGPHTPFWTFSACPSQPRDSSGRVSDRAVAGGGVH